MSTSKSLGRPFGIEAEFLRYDSKMDAKLDSFLENGAAIPVKLVLRDVGKVRL